MLGSQYANSMYAYSSMAVMRSVQACRLHTAYDVRRMRARARLNCKREINFCHSICVAILPVLIKMIYPHGDGTAQQMRQNECSLNQCQQPRDAKSKTINWSLKICISFAVVWRASIAQYRALIRFRFFPSSHSSLCTYLNFTSFFRSPRSSYFDKHFFFSLNASDNMHNCVRTSTAFLAASALCCLDRRLYSTIIIVMLNADEYSEYFLIVRWVVFCLFLCYGTAGRSGAKLHIVSLFRCDVINARYAVCRMQ